MQPGTYHKLSQGEPEKDGTAAPRGWKLKAITLVVSATSMTLLFALIHVGCSKKGLGMVLKHHAAVAAQLKVETRVRQNVSSNLLAADYSPKCWPWTGGTCNIYECDAYRKAKCVSHLCECGEGQCTGADFSCQYESNKRIGQTFTFTNVAYQERLYVPTNALEAQLRTTSGSDGDQNFVLYQVPGKNDASMKMYVVTSEKYPEYVVAWQTNPFKFISQQVEGVTEFPLPDPNSELRVAVTPAKRFSENPSNIFWTICEVTRGSGRVRLGIRDLVWAYEHRFSWMIWGWIVRWWGEPDDRAEWVADPPLPFQLEPCSLPKEQSGPEE